MNLFQVAEIKISYSYNGLGPKISNSQTVYDIVLNTWDDIDYFESFKIILLNQANKVLGISLISIGGLSSTPVDLRKIFQCALKANATGIILCHNHPSGNLNPSQSDIELTKRCKEAGAILNISVFDHLIITKTDYCSLADTGQI